LAQDATATPTPTPQAPTTPAQTTQAQTTQAQTPGPVARTPAPSRTRAPGQRPATQAGQRQAAAPAPTVLAPIQRIVVQGNQRIEPATVISYLLIHPGDTFDPERVDLSLKTLFATGLFADVQITQRDQDLVVSVIENPIINRVIFEGLHSVKSDDLQNEVQAKPRSVFTAAR